MSKIPEPKKLNLESNFFQVENLALELPGNEFKAYCVLRAFSYGKDIIDKSSNYLAKHGKMNEKTFRTAIKKLEEKQYIKVYKKPVNNIKEQNVYQLLPLSSAVKNTLEDAETGTVKTTGRRTVKTTLGSENPKVKTTAGPKVKLTVNSNNKEIKKDSNNKGGNKGEKPPFLQSPKQDKKIKPEPLSTERLLSLKNNKANEPLSHGEFLTYYQEEHEKVFGNPLNLHKVTDSDITNGYNYLLGYGVYKHSVTLDQFNYGQLIRFLPEVLKAFKKIDGYHELTLYMAVNQRETMSKAVKEALTNSEIPNELEETKPYYHSKGNNTGSREFNSTSNQSKRKKEVIPSWFNEVYPQNNAVKVGNNIF